MRAEESTLFSSDLADLTRMSFVAGIPARDEERLTTACESIPRASIQNPPPPTASPLTADRWRENSPTCGESVSRRARFRCELIDFSDLNSYPPIEVALPDRARLKPSLKEWKTNRKLSIIRNPDGRGWFSVSLSRDSVSFGDASFGGDSRGYLDCRFWA